MCTHKNETPESDACWKKQNAENILQVRQNLWRETEHLTLQVKAPLSQPRTTRSKAVSGRSLCLRQDP